MKDFRDGFVLHRPFDKAFRFVRVRTRWPTLASVAWLHQPSPLATQRNVWPHGGPRAICPICHFGRRIGTPPRIFAAIGPWEQAPTIVQFYFLVRLFSIKLSAKVNYIKKTWKIALCKEADANVRQGIGDDPQNHLMLSDQ